MFDSIPIGIFCELLSPDLPADTYTIHLYRNIASATRQRASADADLIRYLYGDILIGMRDIKYRSNDLLSAYMRDTMKSKGITQTDMAKASGRAQSYIAKHLEGESTWKLDDIEAIAPLFGFPNVTSFLSAATDYRH